MVCIIDILIKYLQQMVQKVAIQTIDHSNCVVYLWLESTTLKRKHISS